MTSARTERPQRRNTKDSDSKGGERVETAQQDVTFNHQRYNLHSGKAEPREGCQERGRRARRCSPALGGGEMGRGRASPRQRDRKG